MRRGASHDSGVIVPHAPAWECSSRRSASSRGRGASGKACDAERRTIVGLSFRTLQRGHAVLDALRRQEGAERRTIVRARPAPRQCWHLLRRHQTA
ncbi:DUF1534 domain-containing protein [Pseudomonas syringae]|nr:DUF1534 domain-containing protein [Pseudomonas syringae]PYD09926.1 DUF1534 domain-containing protein [Pseudomonas syringae pv. syringae]MCF5312132.1 DUF1534 domain-containing protein [Pseudomonas syringae]MCF5363870.1 DUF1534 domain-containing protein [Pseudomonas syringae]MCF5392293.1 DUF1534 domain-containing protein [Pseudomonas syringae]